MHVVSTNQGGGVVVVSALAWSTKLIDTVPVMQSSPAYQRPQLHLCNEYRMPPLDSYLVSTVDLTSNRHYSDFTGFQYTSE